MGRQFIEAGPGKDSFKVHGTGGVLRKERQADGRFGRGGEFYLCFFRCFGEALHGHGIPGKVQVVLLFELLQEPADDTLVEVVAPQMIVARGGEHLDGVAVDVQNADVEGAAAQVVAHDFAGLPLVKAVGTSRRGGLVDNPQDVQSGNQSGVLGRLALCVGKIGGDGDHRVGDSFPDIAFRIRLQLLQDHGGNLLGRITLSVNAETGFAPHIPLDGGKSAGGIGYGLALGGHADKPFAGFGESHDRWCGPAAFRVGNDDGPPVLHKSDAGIRGSQVDTDQL